MSPSTFVPPSTASRFHRLGGPLGGVSSGLANTFGVRSGVVRLGFAATALLFGFVVVAVYLALWFVMPIDRSVPEDRRPGPPPLSLVVIVAVLYGLSAVLGLTMGLLSAAVSLLLPVAFLVVAVGLLAALWRRSASRTRAVR